MTDKRDAGLAWALCPGSMIAKFASARSDLLLCGFSDRILARLAQRREMLSDAQKDAALAALDPAALRLDIRRAGVAHRGDPHERSLAWLGEILEMRLDAFGDTRS